VVERDCMGAVRPFSKNEKKNISLNHEKGFKKNKNAIDEIHNP
jgi:hypothetical protein